MRWWGTWCSVVVVLIIAACGDDGASSVADGGIDGDTGSDIDAEVMGPRCGDGVVDTGEGCDDGNTSDADACLSTCVLASCGDGVMQSGEQCDAGTANSDTAADACRANCLTARCGDTVTDTGEACDDGNQVNTDGCVGTCDAATCGDGYLRAGTEQCDNGTLNSDSVADACRTTCVPADCGDNVTDTGETCDDGNASNVDGCLDTCTSAGCGDGYVYGGVEDCDDGNLDNTDSCLACAAAECGDGYVWQGVEDCDAGGSNSNSAPNACRTTCKPARCGDGVVDNGETCDASGVATAACDVDCTAPSCPDGVTNTAAGETCDDGNGAMSDGCSSCAIDSGWIVYVRVGATGANTGTSWQNAYTSLRDALAATTQGEIWVAAGTYYPDRGTGVTLGDRTAAFVLRSNVRVYGGFAGTETARVQRNPATNVTRLSGDIGTASVATDNSVRVLNATSITGSVLDGFTVEHGYNTLGGAGMVISSSSLAIANCVFSTNQALLSTTSSTIRGGALYVSAGTVTIDRTTFVDNRAQSNTSTTSGRGGAMAVVSDAVVVIRDSVFDGNVAASQGLSQGGAIYADSAELRVLRTAFTDNQSIGDPSHGGALYLVNFEVNYPASHIQSSTFDNNSAEPRLGTQGACYGGAIFSGGNSDVQVGNTLFSNNSADCRYAYGGAVYAYGFSGDSAFDNCTFANNSAYASYITAYGGAIYMSDYVSPSVYNSVFWGNRAYSQGGHDIYESANSNGYVGYSCTQTNQGGTGNTVISASPFGSNYRLAAGSTCIDSGSNSSAPNDFFDLDGDATTSEATPLDLTGYPRFVDDPTKADTGVGTAPIVDRGAYERR